MELLIILLIILQYISFIYNLEYVSNKIKKSKTKRDYYYYKIIRFSIPTIIFLILFSVSYFHDFKVCGLIIIIFLLLMALKLIPQVCNSLIYYYLN